MNSIVLLIISSGICIKKNRVYSYYEVKDKNDSYLVLEVKIRNNSGSSVEPEDLVNCRVTVDNKYEYTGFLVYTEFPLYSFLLYYVKELIIKDE